jgi:hypothetical protein
MINSKIILLFFFASILFWGCSTPVVKTGNGEPAGRHLIVEDLFQKGPSPDQVLFDEALSSLRNKQTEPNYIEAKTRLEKLLSRYPQTKWLESAQALIACLDKISTLETRLKQDKQKAQTDQVKLLKEMEGQKESNKLVEDRYSAELAKLQMENEQLKNDIQQLKKLEVQLEKREKMLR